MPTRTVGFLALLLVLVVVYYPAATMDFAYSDDLNMHYGAKVMAEASTRSQINDGRFLYPLWLNGPVAHVRGLTGFKYVRLATLPAIFLSALLLGSLVRRWLVKDELWAVSAAVLFSVNPGFLALGTWAALGSHCWAAALGMLSIWILLGKPAREPGNGTAGVSIEPVGRSPGRAGLAGLMLFLALGFYQSSAMCYWGGVAVWMLARFDGRRAAWCNLAWITGLFFAVTGLYFVLAKHLTDSSSRLQIAFSPIRRLAWFVWRPLRGALGFPLLQPPVLWSALAGCAIAFGLWRLSQRERRPLLVLPMLGGLTILATMPSLAAAMYYDVFRIRIALYAVLAVLSVAALLAWRNGSRVPHRAGYALAAFALVAALLGQYHILHDRVLPAVLEEGCLQARLRDYLAESPDHARPIHLIPAIKSDEFCGGVALDEFGIPSTGQVWAPVPLVRLLLASALHVEVGTLQDLAVTVGDEPTPPGAYLIDLHSLQLPR